MKRSARYQFNPHLSSDETVTNILVKALTVFPTPDFSLCLHLLPPHILHPDSASSSLPAAGDAPLSEAVQKLTDLNNLLSEAKYKEFWNTLESDDLYADLTADVSGFEELMRVRIAVVVGQSCKEIERPMMEGWLKLKGADFDKFIADICGWGLDTTRPDAKGGMIVVPESKENQARSTVIRENVSFDRKYTAISTANVVLTHYRIRQGHPTSLRAACVKGFV
jgi:translation initiation factor 3 subunit K